MEVTARDDHCELEDLFRQLVKAVMRHLWPTRNGAVGVEDIAQEIALRLCRPRGLAFLRSQARCLRRLLLPRRLKKQAQRLAMRFRGKALVASLRPEDLDRGDPRQAASPGGEVELEEFLLHLPPNLRVIARLAQEEVPRHLIAEQLGVSERTLRNRLRDLRERFAQEGYFTRPSRTTRLET
jgi:DNA-directed RNA polymerase specialized sigma24 family protein